MPNRSLFLVSGERSGDLHAAELLCAFSETEKGKGMSFYGLGGSELVKRYGDQFEDWVEEAAVIGITEVLKKYGWFKKKFAETIHKIETLSPDVVVLVDYPGFNLRLARALRKNGYSGKICYYISPQVWAWNQSRIPKMAQLLDFMMCVFEFEKDLYQKSGLLTEWVGHPMVEELEERRENIQRRDDLIALIPGSRSREVRSLLPAMLSASERVAAKFPDASFELAVASERILPIAKELFSQSPLYHKGKIKITIGESHRLMQEATAAWIASGTATLEAGFYGLPYALVYKVSSLTYWMAKMLVKIPYIGMVNILADQLVVQEFIQDEAHSDNLAQEMNKMMGSLSYRQKMAEELHHVKTQLGGGGAHHKAAIAISDCLSKD